MKIIQTFWSKPFLDHNCTRLNGGWLEKKHHYMSWALSCLQLSKYYKEVELITDAEGKRLLTDVLDLPYTTVNSQLDTLDSYHSELWSLPKIHAYSLQAEPFIHVDGDFFAFAPFPKRIEQAGIAIQNRLSVNTPKLNVLFDQINARFLVVPNYMKVKLKTGDYFTFLNQGIFGGHDLSSIQQYCKECFTFITNNLPVIQRSVGYIERDALAVFDVNYIELFNSIIESHILGSLLEQEHIPVESLLDEAVLLTYPYGNLLETKKTFVHPVYHQKKYGSVCCELEYKLKNNFPHHYYKIVSLVEECQL